MLSNMDLLNSFDPNTKIYCAHEYTLSNLKFLASVSRKALTIFDEVKELRKNNVPTIPGSIGKEKEYNLFMKCREEETQRITDTIGSAEKTMGVLREMKNSFR